MAETEIAPESPATDARPPGPSAPAVGTATAAPKRRRFERLAKAATRLRAGIQGLYEGYGPVAEAFRYALITFDIVTIAFFVVSTFIDDRPWLAGIEIAIAAVIATDLLARFAIARRRLWFLVEPFTVVDIAVLILLLAPALTNNYGFLRVLRALRLVRSYQVFGRLRNKHRWFRRNDEVIQSALNLFVFVFVITAFVYVLQVDKNDGITTYVDALYFTITTLTTTGFGDIVLVGDDGRLLAVGIMVFGISLFIRLVHAVFRPSKVFHTCLHCGLSRHDPDAVHCKHCGNIIHIPTEGDG